MMSDPDRPVYVDGELLPDDVADMLRDVEASEPGRTWWLDEITDRLADRIEPMAPALRDRHERGFY